MAIWEQPPISQQQRVQHPNQSSIATGRVLYSEAAIPIMNWSGAFGFVKDYIALHRIALHCIALHCIAFAVICNVLQ